MPDIPLPRLNLSLSENFIHVEKKTFFISANFKAENFSTFGGILSKVEIFMHPYVVFASYNFTTRRWGSCRIYVTEQQPNFPELELE